MLTGSGRGGFRFAWPATFAARSKEQFRRDLLAGVNVMTLAFPLSMAFAIASGLKPEQGLYTAIIGGFIVAVLSGSPVQIGGPTGAFIVIIYGVLERHGFSGLVTCTVLAGLMLCAGALLRLGSVIRFIPFPVSRAFTTGIAVLILSTQIKDFLGLDIARLPADFAGKMKLLAAQAGTLQWPTVALALATLVVIAAWPKRLGRYIPGPMAGLIFGTAVVGFFGLELSQHIATVGTQYGAVTWALPAWHWPGLELGQLPELLRVSFTIALLVAMQGLLCAVVTDGMLDHRHDSNRELLAQGIANIVAPLFGCLPTTAGVARSVVNVSSGGRTPIAGITHSLLLLVMLMVAAPLITHVPLATLSAILVVAAFNMAGWNHFARLIRWPRGDAAVFVTTLALTVFTNLTIAVEVGVVLAALLLMKRIAETTQITAVDERTETEGSQHSLVGKVVPEGVLIYRVFGAFFFGAVDKLNSELKRVRREPDVLILRVRKVLAIDATGLQALEDLHARLRAKGKHLVLSAPHTQPLAVMENSGFIDRLGRENVCPDVTAALARARAILGLPPVDDQPEAPEALHAQKQELDAARRELSDALERANRMLNKPSAPRPADEAAPKKP